MKKIIKAILIVFLFLGGIYLAKDRVLSLVVPHVISRMLGSTVRVEHVSLSISEQSLVVEGLEVFNPEGFPKQIMLDVPLIHAHIDIDSFFQYRLYISSLKVNIETINIHFNSKQMSNIQYMIDNRFAQDIHLWPYRVDHLALVLGQVRVEDLKNIEKPKVSLHNIFNYHVYEDVSDVDYLGTALVIDAIKMASIKGLTLQGIESFSDKMLGPVKKAGSYVGLDPLTEVVPISAMTVTKVLFLPFESISTVFGGGTLKVCFATDVDRTYQGALNVLQKYGTIIKNDKKNGELVAKVQAIKISVRVKAITGGTELVVVAREGKASKVHFSRALVYYLARDLAQDYPVHSTKSVFLK